MQLTSVFYKLLKAKTKFVISQGGTSASKTYSMLQLLYLKAQKHPGLHISVVAESLPVLKRGALKDFINMLKQEEVYKEENHNKTNNTYEINGSVIEFFSVDDSSKARGARRDILFVNEANNIHWETFSELYIRTKGQNYIDFNPVSSFWAHEKLMLLPQEEWTFIKSTYRDNNLLDKSIVRAIELKAKNEPEWAKVFADGEIGSNEGLVFHNWGLCDKMPDEPKWEKWGIDFGFTNDPSTCIHVMLSEGELWIDEIIYERGLINRDIYERVKDIPNAEFIADSAEPKSIEELSRMGLYIKGAQKGPDSIRLGIDLIKKYKMNITKRSTNLIKELRNYQWRKMQDGSFENKPIDAWNHGIDSVRYVLLDKELSNQISEYEDDDFDIYNL